MKSANFSAITQCRICGNSALIEVLDLGVQSLTGVFPELTTESITEGPLKLVKCHGDDFCGLLQLAHSFCAGEMYGENYGYRSGLNVSMVQHLANKVHKIESIISLSADDLVVDIGSNDGTTLAAYANKDLHLVGIDPTGNKFIQFYEKHISLLPDFFSAENLRKVTKKKASVVTSFSMFYDLEDPLKFMRDVRSVLAQDGIWVFEQSYMPKMLELGSYDTVCHEHLEFYSLHQIKWMADRAGLSIADVEFNDVNGGSISITCVRSDGTRFSESELVASILASEIRAGLSTLDPYYDFAKRVIAQRDSLIRLIATIKSEGKTISAVGASTKGNVLLQYCGLSEREIDYVGEVNIEKVGRFTPGSLIPIIEEERLLHMSPDYLLILPWHFRDFFESSKKLKHFKRIYPLPSIDVL